MNIEKANNSSQRILLGGTLPHFLHKCSSFMNSCISPGYEWVSFTPRLRALTRSAKVRSLCSQRLKVYLLQLLETFEPNERVIFGQIFLENGISLTMNSWRDKGMTWDYDAETVAEITQIAIKDVRAVNSLKDILSRRYTVLHIFSLAGSLCDLYHIPHSVPKSKECFRYSEESFSFSYTYTMRKYSPQAALSGFKLE